MSTPNDPAQSGAVQQPPPQQYQQQPPQQFQQQQPHMVQHQQPHMVQQPVMMAPPVPVFQSPGVVQNNKVEGYPYSPDIGEPMADLCDCDQICIMSTFFPFIVGGQLSQKLGISTFMVVCATYLAVFVVLLIISLVAFSVTGFSPFIILWVGWAALVMTLRSRVRNMWRFPGDDCNDFCMACCCNPCSLAQLAKHVFGYRKDDSINWGEDGTPMWQHQAAQQQAQQQSQQQVQYPPQMLQQQQQYAQQQPQMMHTQQPQMVQQPQMMQQHYVQQPQVVQQAQVIQQPQVVQQQQPPPQVAQQVKAL